MHFRAYSQLSILSYYPFTKIKLIQFILFFKLDGHFPNVILECLFEDDFQTIKSSTGHAESTAPNPNLQSKELKKKNFLEQSQDMHLVKIAK